MLQSELLKQIDSSNTFILVILGTILIILIFLFYYYSFSKRNYDKVIEVSDYPSKINLKNLKTCAQITNPDDDTILADYYIASSYNTACIGNQRYDYVSLEMIETVLRSGARYIELQICQDALMAGSEPVVATGDKYGSWINSLNVLKLSEVCNVISKMAFVKDGDPLNYPLFIYLNLKTEDKNTLDSVADILRQYFKVRLLDTVKYHKYPLAHERLCNLLNKIIILASEEYSFSDELTKIVIPTEGFIKRYKFDELDKINGTPEQGTAKYSTILSRKAQAEDDIHFKSKYPDITSVKMGTNYLDELKTDKQIVDVLTHFNKAGLAIIIPHNDKIDDDPDVFTLNYDILNPMNYGCQFIAVNYQLHDNIMDKYLDMFQTSSFVLKPIGSRFHKNNIPVEDIMNKYPIPTKLNYTILEDFSKQMSGKLVAIQSFSNQDLYLSKNGENLKFEGIPIKNRIKSGKEIRYKFPIKQCFLIVPSKNSRYPNGIMFAHGQDITQYISSGSDYLYLNTIGTDQESIKLSTFLPIASSCGSSDTTTNDNNTWNGYISFATTNKDEVLVIGNYSGYLKEFQNTNNINVVQNTCFHLVNVPHRKFIQLQHYTGKYIYIRRDNNVGIDILMLGHSSIPKKEKDRYSFEMINIGDNKIVLSSGIGKFLRLDTNKHIIADTDQDNATTFLLYMQNGQYVVRDEKGAYMVPEKGSDNREKGLGEFIQMQLDNPLLKAEKISKTGKTLSVPVYGPELGTSKYYKVRFEYMPI